MNNLTTRRDDDKGFTLIELMVVVLIIAILLAIAIPTFLGAQNKAKDRSAQSSARNSLTNAKTIFADSGDYTLVTPALLNASEPSLTFQAAASTGPKVVSVVAPATTEWYAAVMSQTGTCFYLWDSVAAAGNGTQYAKVENADPADCVANFAGIAYIDKW
jgi:type IV pilus assembly protein PilA